MMRRRFRVWGLVGGMVLMVAACNTAGPAPVPTIPPGSSEVLPTVGGEVAPTMPALDAGAQGQPITLFVGPERVPCEGMGPQECFQVRRTPDGPYELFYDDIEGFVFEPGYTYELLIDESLLPEPPGADSSGRRYMLLQLVNQQPVAPGTPTPATAEGGAGEGGTGAAPMVSGTRFVETIGGEAVVSAQGMAITFGEDGLWRGTTGCNEFRAQVQITGQALAVGPVITTRRGCPPEEAAQERRFLEALALTTSWQVDESTGQVTLLDASGTPLLVLVAAG